MEANRKNPDTKPETALPAAARDGTPLSAPVVLQPPRRAGHLLETTMDTRSDDRRLAAKDRSLAGWLTRRPHDGHRRVEIASWEKLAAMYMAARPGSAVRKVINAECRRLGYTPRNIIALHAE